MLKAGKSLRSKASLEQEIKMASLSSLIATSLPKFGHAGAAIARSRTWNPRIFSAATPRPIQVYIKKIYIYCQENESFTCFDWKSKVFSLFFKSNGSNLIIFLKK